jgi:methionyl-tRNA formyltransferase
MGVSALDPIWVHLGPIANSSIRPTAARDSEERLCHLLNREDRIEVSRDRAQSLINKLNASKPFEVVGKNDTAEVVVLVTCSSRSKQTDPFLCMYVAHFNGAAFKTFLGGGMWVTTSADAVSDNFLASIAQDIVERFDSTSKDNLRETLQACLLMTDSKCNVPDPLQKEFGATQLTLGQYLLKKRQ